ncbi:uncharacterized protein [Littorina saxatilis]|uniref:Geminin n=1 Tax=Littorina saxatilis TaxID=31220 RepID=A0AAN9B7A9_9CAEN
MASDELIALPRDHSTPKQNHKTYGNVNSEGHDRKSLQTLQQSAFDDKALVGVGLTPIIAGKNGKPGEKMKIKPTHGPVRVFHDSNSNRKASEERKSGKSECVTTQTDDSLLEDLIDERLQEQHQVETASKRTHSFVENEEDEAYELMIKEPVPESYWKEIAEQRRQALNDTLEENRSLHLEVDSLREENEKLMELSSQAAALSALLQSVVSDTENRDDDCEEKETDKDPDATEEQNNENGSSESTDAYFVGKITENPKQETVTQSQTSSEVQNGSTDSGNTVADQQKLGESTGGENKS